jgi:hypothetical protein
VEAQTMAKIDEIETLTVDPYLVPAVAQASHAAACIFLQLLVEARGQGAWIDELHQDLRGYLERQPVPKGHGEWVEKRWVDMAKSELDVIFAHSAVGDDIPKPKH